MPFSSSEDIISKLQKQLGLDDKMYAAIQVWDKEMAHIFHYAELKGIQNGQLILEVVSSVHFQELALRRNEIIIKMNQYLGKEDTIKGIKINLK